MPQLILRNIERFPLGTSYTFYAGALHKRITQIDAIQNPRDITLAVDAGGPGAPVVDEIRRASLNVRLKPVIITGAQEPSISPGGYTNVPRKILITNLILLLDHGTLAAPKELENWPLLVEEMIELSAATSHPAKTTAHDDMVMALALAAWQATQRYNDLLPSHSRKKEWSPLGGLF